MSKWTFLFVFLGMMNTYGVAYSQNKQQVTISMQDVFLKDIQDNRINRKVKGIDSFQGISEDSNPVIIYYEFKN